MLSATRPKPIGSTEMIADALRGAICSGEIAPGAPLKQDEIAARRASAIISVLPIGLGLAALGTDISATLI